MLLFIALTLVLSLMSTNAIPEIPEDLLQCTAPYETKLRQCYDPYFESLADVDLEVVDANPELLSAEDQKIVCCAFFTVLKPCQVSVLKGQCRKKLISYYNSIQKSDEVLAKACVPRKC